MSSRTEEYVAQIASHFPDEIAEQVLNPTPQVSESGIPYVRFRAPQPTQDGAFLLVPGFGEGIINKISFAAEMAYRGADMVLAGQNRGTGRDEDGERLDVLENHAQRYQGIVDETGARKLLGHSFGAQIVDRMVREHPELYADETVGLLAPSGTIADQTSLRITTQWLRMMRSESNPRRPEVSDPKGVTGQASAMELSKNVPLTIREMLALRDREIDYDTLTQLVGRLLVVTYAEDYMFPDNLLEPRLARAVKAGATWIMPHNSASFASGLLKNGREGAVHDDEQYNPSRVVSALLDAWQ